MATKLFGELIKDPMFLLDLVSIKNLKTVCLPIGFPRCADQVLTCALTAHPNIVMCQQMKVLQEWLDTTVTHGKFYATKKYLFDILLKNREIILNKKKGVLRSDKFYLIPSQWQGRVKQLSVIGDCSVETNTRVLSKQNFHLLEIFKETIKTPLKFIFLVRNPYDMIGTRITRRYLRRRREEIIKTILSLFIKDCIVGEKLLTEVSPDQVFLWRLEDHIADPQKKLSELCSFLNVESTQSYLDDCAKIFYKKPSRSRYLIDWPDDYKAQVAAAIEQYDFFSGYSWDS